MNSLHEVGVLFVKAGVNKVNRSIIKMLVLSVFGGFFIGLSAAFSSLLDYNLLEGYTQFYKGMVFPLGTIIVYCAGGELITGNFLLTIGFFATKIKLLEMLLSWLIVFVGNFIGCILISLLIVYSHLPNMFNVNLARIVIVTGNEKCGLNFGEAFIKAMLGNFFNCLGLWLAMIGKDMRSVLLGLFIPNFLLMALGLNHCVADMYYILAGLFTSYEYGLDSTEMSWGKLFYKSIIPDLLGNAIGGGILIGVMYWYLFLNREAGEHRVKKKKIKENNSINKFIENNKSTNINQNPDISSLKMLDN